jgi:phenylacetate-coenzyme A ligase PaaK-like adenylate-forming protein
LTSVLERAYVFASGGSTGAPKFSFYSYDEWDQVTSILAEIYQVAGISSRDVVGNLFMAGNLWTSFIVANEALAKIGCVTLPIAGNADVELVLRYMQLFNPTALVGLPSIIIQIAEEVERRGLHPKVDKILYGGEHLGAQVRNLLRRALGATVIVSAGYASVDAGPIGYQCHETPGSVHHLLYDYQYLEILDVDTLEPIKGEREGEIVITNMERHLMPILRYRTGDRGRWVRTPCACGRRTPLFELLGRVDDVVRVGSVSVYPDSIADVLAQVPGASQLFQIVAANDGTKDSLTIRTEYAGHNGTALEAVREGIYQTLLSDNGELAEALREGWLGSLSVEVLAPGGLPRIRRTGKIKKVVDLRRP